MCRIVDGGAIYGRRVWRGVKRRGMDLCSSDSWAPPVSLLRAASRDQTANQRPHKLSLSFVWSLLVASGLTIGWLFSFSSFACRCLPCFDSSAYTRLVFRHAQDSLSATELAIHSIATPVGSHLLSATVTLQRPVPHTGSSNHQPQAPLSCFDQTIQQHLFSSTSHPALVCVVDLFGESPWFLD